MTGTPYLKRVSKASKLRMIVQQLRSIKTPKHKGLLTPSLASVSGRYVRRLPATMSVSSLTRLPISGGSSASLFSSILSVLSILKAPMTPPGKEGIRFLDRSRLRRVLPVLARAVGNSSSCSVPIRQ